MIQINGPFTVIKLALSKTGGTVSIKNNFIPSDTDKHIITIRLIYFIRISVKFGKLTQYVFKSRLF